MNNLEEEVEIKESNRKQLHSMLQLLKGSMRVYCRVKPSKPDGKDVISIQKACKDELPICLNLKVT